MNIVTAPDAEDLDTALARGIVRQQIVACDRYLALLAQAGELAQEQKIADSIDLMTLVDLQSNVRHHRDALEDAVARASSHAERTADREPSTRPSIEVLRRITL